jgi:glycosyltransferase involved in cell wall biosynthesis
MPADKPGILPPMVEHGAISTQGAHVQPGVLRVLHVQSGLYYGGIQRMLICMAESRRLCPEMVSVFALCYKEQLAEELTGIGAEVRYLGPARIREPWNLWRANRRLRALLSSEHFDAVACHGSPPLAMFGSEVRRSGIPLVFWMHNDIKKRNRNPIEFLAGLQRPDLVIANSRFTASSLPLHFTRVPPHVVVPCPVTPPPPLPGQEERRRIRADFDTPPESVLIVLAGRPEAWKGHALLLESLALLRSLPDWSCWIIGGPFDTAQAAFLEKLRAFAGESGIAERVRFLGQRQDVPKLLAAADIFCHPNLTPEPFGIVFIEALYAGLPVVSADHGGAQEIVDPSCGRLVKPGDVQELAAVLENLIRDSSLRASLSRNAPVRGAVVSDPARILARTHEQLALLSRPPAGPDRVTQTESAKPLLEVPSLLDDSSRNASVEASRLVTIRTMMGAKNLDLSIKCLGSILKFSPHPTEILIHEDGGLGEAARERLVAELGRVRFQDRSESNEIVNEMLRGSPRCRAFRDRDILAMQVLDIPLLTPTDQRVVYSDADILYTRPVECPQFFIGGGFPFVGSRDLKESYAVSLRQWGLLNKFGVRLASRLCAGMMSFDLAVYDLDYIEWLLRLDEESGLLSGYPFFVSQTLCAALAGRADGRRGCVDPDECIVAHRFNFDRLNTASIIHFAGYSRHLFDGVYNAIDFTSTGRPRKRLSTFPVPVCGMGRRLLSAVRSRVFFREDPAGVR